MKNKIISTPASPWHFFLLFLLANGLLSYAPLGMGAKVGVGLLGLALPLIAAFGGALRFTAGRPPLFQQEILPPLSLKAWGGILVLALWGRFSYLETLSVWPHADEGFINYFSFQLSHRWNWDLFYGPGQVPPAYLWLEAPFLGWVGPSLSSLWFFPALLSALTIPVGYAACRRFFSRSFSFFTAALVALSFFPLYIGRFSFMTVLVLPFEYLALYLLGRFWKAGPGPGKKWEAGLLGIGLGLGFYVHLHWLVCAAFLAPLVLGLILFQKNRRGELTAFFLVPLFLLTLPLIVGGMRAGYGLYLRDLLSPSASSGIPGAYAPFYLSSLFWGLSPRFHAYQSFWGGFLNPLLGALFCLGLVETLSNLRHFLYRVLAAALVFFFLPAVFTQTLEPFRLVPLIPFLLAVAALGWGRLALCLPKNKAAGATLLLLLCSFGLDLYHLEGPYHRNWDQPENWRNCLKSIERYRAYEILRETSHARGPGIILSDFVPGNCDPTLSLADFSFNAAQNPSLDPGKAGWFALLVNIHYQPFLAERFAGSKTYPLSKDLSGGDGGLMLWTAPLTPENRGRVERWRLATEALDPFIRQNLSYIHGKSFQPVLDSLSVVYPAFEGDPFLESVFWEKTADTYFKMGSSDRRAPLQALLQAVKKGYPAAHLYYDLGVFYWINQNPGKAREAFQRASKAPFDFTGSAGLLQKIGKP